MKNLLYVALLVTFFSCEKPAPEIVNEEELITTLLVELTNGVGEKTYFTFRDLDGDGGNPPTMEIKPLKSNTIYKGQIFLLNELVTPSDISEEVRKEKEDHQFFYLSDSPQIKVDYADKDRNDRPVGLSITLTTTTVGNSKLKITLRHKPNKMGLNVAAGDISNAGGETDIQVEFDIVVK